jgi:hypothetical protein
LIRDHIIFGIFGASFIAVGAGFVIDADRTFRLLRWRDLGYSKRWMQILGGMFIAFGVWFEFQTFTRW